MASLPTMTGVGLGRKPDCCGKEGPEPKCTLAPWCLTSGDPRASVTMARRVQLNEPHFVPSPSSL